MRNPRFDFEVPTLAEFLNNPQEELDSKALEISSVEDTQIHAVEEPLAGGKGGSECFFFLLLSPCVSTTTSHG